MAVLSLPTTQDAQPKPRRSAGNPIVRQELSYQRYTAAKPRFRWLAPLYLILMILVCYYALNDIRYATRELTAIMIWVVNAAVCVHAILCGANVFSREHVGQTWDSLVLTGLPAHRIILGKWTAAMHRAAPGMFVLGALRLALLPVFTMGIVNRFADYYMRYNGYYSSNYSGQYDEFPEFSYLPFAFAAAVLFAVVLSVLEIAACTALGMAASAVTRRHIPALIIAGICRFATVAFFGVFIPLEFWGEQSWRVLRFTPMALADGGTAALSRMVAPLMPWSRGTTHSEALASLLTATVFFVGLTVISLLVCRAAVKRAGAL